MKSVFVGFDAFDPRVFERLLSQDQLPNLKKFTEGGSYRHLAVANPAQSEVSWTSMATGLNPAGHGLFDFVHRNPENYGLQVSLLPTTSGVLGTQFTQPHQAKTFFDQAVENGYPATSLWWPATFPARLGSPVQSIPGLGTPDIQGQLGVGAFFTAQAGLKQEDYKSRLNRLEADGARRFKAALAGPGRKKGGAVEPLKIPFAIEFNGSDGAALEIDGQRLELKLGEWSPIFELTFKMGMLSSLTAITRAIVSKTPEPQIYFLPLQIHPLHSPWAYGAPPGLVKSAWQNAGPFLTLGWPQDTTALEEDIITDDQFLALCEDVMASRERVFMQQLAAFEEGVLAIVFDTLDRVQHMFFTQDESLLASWYVKLDALFGRIQDQLEAGGHQDARIIIASDHGFAPYEHKIHLNRWLMENGWTAAKSPEPHKDLNRVDWPRTRAYALGLNSLYLNMEGREGQGLLAPADVERTRNELKNALLKWKGPDGRNVLDEVWFREKVFEGPHLDHAPDLLMGYAPGYRASAETGLGGYGASALEPNRDHWSADHCIHPAAVPGVLMTSFDLQDLEHPSYEHIPELVLGSSFETTSSKPTEKISQEEQEIIEERMKGLGYL